jgi:urease subunit gamma/beta
MHLDPTEHDRLLVFAAAELARRNRADGCLLSAPEAIAIVCDEAHRAARRGADYAEVVAAARAAVDVDEVLDGVAALVPQIRVEVLLDEGTRLLVLDEPFGASPPQVVVGEEPVVCNAGRPVRRLRVRNASAQPVRVSSHQPFWEVNARLEFDRTAARGHRLDLVAGDTVRWEPGEEREVRLVALGGEWGSGEGPGARDGGAGDGT